MRLLNNSSHFINCELLPINDVVLLCNQLPESKHLILDISRLLIIFVLIEAADLFQYKYLFECCIPRLPALLKFFPKCPYLPSNCSPEGRLRGFKCRETPVETLNFLPKRVILSDYERQLTFQVSHLQVCFRGADMFHGALEERVVLKLEGLGGILSVLNVLHF